MLKGKNKKDFVRFSVYLTKTYFEMMEKLSCMRGDRSYAETLRAGLDLLEITGKNGLSKDVLQMVMGVYHTLTEEIAKGRNIVIEDPNTQERTRILIPKLR